MDNNNQSDQKDQLQSRITRLIQGKRWVNNNFAPIAVMDIEAFCRELSVEVINCVQQSFNEIDWQLPEITDTMDYLFQLNRQFASGGENQSIADKLILPPISTKE